MKLPSLKIAALAACAAYIADAGAQANLDFEDAAEPAGWEVTGANTEAGIDDEIAHRGQRSLRLSNGSDDRVARVVQRIPAAQLPTERLRLAAYIRTENVGDGSAGLWLRIDGADRRLYFDGLRESGAHGTADWRYYSLDAPLLDAAQTITFGLELAGPGTAWFDAVVLEPVDTVALPAPAPAAVRYLNYALDIIEDNSIKRATIDWPTFRAKAGAQARGAVTPGDTHLALKYALGNLGDGHSYLMTPDRAERLAFEPVSNARTGRRPEPPRAERMSETVAYLWIPGFAGGTQTQQADFAEQVQRLIAGLDSDGLCGWVVDLRDNTGGNLWPMLAGLGPLLGDGEAGAALNPDGTSKPFWYRDGQAGYGDYVQLRVATQAYRTRRPAAPVAVLAGPRTASSGEVILGAFQARPNTASFGSATRGLSTGNRTFPLGDGAALVLTVAATRDRHGRVYEGPIQPTYETDSSRARGPLEQQVTVREAVRWLERDVSCSGS